MNNKILLIDDDKNILSAYQRLLRHKFELVIADSAAGGITILKEQGPFAVIVSDYQMPEMNGVEFLSVARQIAPDAIRIILSGQADLQAAIDAINEGKVYCFLTKPCPADKFIKTLNDAVEQYQLIASERSKERLENLHKTIEGTVDMLVSMVARRDPFTANHQKRVSKLAMAIAGKMGLSPQHIENTSMAARIHDIGKIYVPAEILSKPGNITELERALIMTHSQIGYDILKNIEFSGPIDKIVYQHHERLDGSGYPLGLSGSEIHMEAKVLGVADVVEAIASHRPYRPAFPMEKALEEITQNSGILYDTDVVNACVKVCQTEGFSL